MNTRILAPVWPDVLTDITSSLACEYATLTRDGGSQYERHGRNRRRAERESSSWHYSQDAPLNRTARARTQRFPSISRPG